MSSVIAELVETHAQREAELALGDALDALLEFTGATAGWVGRVGLDGRLTFPVRRGTFAGAWLTLQQGHGTLWGFEVRDGPTLLNDLPALPSLGEPPLRNLLSCPLTGAGAPPGHVVLANKTQGFTSHDAAVAQCAAHLMARQLTRLKDRVPERAALPPLLLWQALARTAEGVLVVDDAGTLVFANTTWLRWTGFGLDDLLHRPAPFPFWISHRDLAALGGQSLPVPPPAAAAPSSRSAVIPSAVRTIVSSGARSKRWSRRLAAED